MKHPQVINLNEDNVIAIDGLNVIHDTTQDELGRVDGETSIVIDIELFDIITGLAITTIEDKTMTYQSAADIWTIEISDISSALTDRHKYIAKITTATAETIDMRDFKLNEFAVDNDSFEDVWMRLPYQIVLTPTPKIIWYSDSIGGTAAFEALVYQDGTGTTAATDASRITHRGAITVVP